MDFQYTQLILYEQSSIAHHISDLSYKSDNGKLPLIKHVTINTALDASEIIKILK